MIGKTENANAWRWLPSSQTLVWVFLILGILLRLRQYLFDRSLWLDESMLALNIIRRSAVELLKPLDYAQAAPVGFLWLEKLAANYFGTSELALRLFPLLCGIVSVALFALVTRKFLPPSTAPIAVGLFSVSEPLIYYSSEVKQYSSDVVFALILCLAAIPLFEASSRMAGVLSISVAGGVALWFSNPAVFILAGVGLSAFWISVRRRDWRAVFLLLIPAVVWSCSFLVYYIFFLRDVLTAHRDLFFFWRASFAPFPLTSPSDALWYASAFVNTVSYPMGSLFRGIAAIAAVLGIVNLRTGNRDRFLILISPMAVTLMASWARLYPLENRLILFLVPIIILFFAAGLESIHATVCKTLPLLSVLFVGFLLVYPLLRGIWHFAKPKGVEEIKLSLEYVEKHRSGGDILYCYYGAVPALEYYTRRGLIGPIDEVIGVDSHQQWASYEEDLNKLRGQKRVWILFSHVWQTGGVDEEVLFLNYLDLFGTRLDSHKVAGASAYLYDLSARRPNPTSSTIRPGALNAGPGQRAPQ
jgi:dolichyl-phosphate-mannose-protein mannosyltransferase